MAAALLCATSPARAQQFSELTGMLTGMVGAATSGDVRQRAVTFGGSSAVIEESGIGAEVEIAHTSEFDPDRFADSTVTSFMVNALRMGRHPKYRPYAAGGVGLLHVGVEVFDGVTAASRTGLGFNGGGGMVVVFSDVIGVRGDVRFFRFFQQYPELPASGTFDYWRVTVGATYSWPIR